jgi:hypothetical protein
MSTGATPNLGPPEITPPLADSLEARASIALKALAAINIAGAVLAQFPPPLPQSQLEALTFNGAAIVLAALEFITARALDRSRPWAVGIVRPLMVLLMAAGAGATLVGAREGVVRLPFEVVFAIWVLLGARDVTLTGHSDRRGGLLIAPTALLVASMLVSEPVFGWGGLLDVHASALRASITADCGSPDASPPPAITVTYDWSWAQTSPLPSGLDIIVLGWNGMDAEGRQLYYFRTALPTGTGVYSGRHDYPSLDMATQVAQGSAGTWMWGVELGEQGMRPGEIKLEMRRANEASPHPGPLVITATYVHLGLWHSTPVRVTCSWAGPSAASVGS